MADLPAWQEAVEREVIVPACNLDALRAGAIAASSTSRAGSNLNIEMNARPVSPA